MWYYLNWYAGTEVRVGDGAEAYGDIRADNFHNESTLRVKTAIKDCHYGLDDILALRPVTFKKKKDSLQTPRRVGLIAEDVYSVIPEAVSLDEEGIPSAINYTPVITALVNSIKELKAEIDKLKRK